MKRVKTNWLFTLGFMLWGALGAAQIAPADSLSAEWPAKRHTLMLRTPNDFLLNGIKPLSLHGYLTPASFHAESLPFFCRIEHQLGQKTRVPFKFRLGSVEYVDSLEGKH